MSYPALTARSGSRHPYTIDTGSITPATQCDQTAARGSGNTHSCNKEIDNLLTKGRTTNQAKPFMFPSKTVLATNDSVADMWLHVPTCARGPSERLHAFEPHDDIVNAP